MCRGPRPSPARRHPEGRLACPPCPCVPAPCLAAVGSGPRAGALPTRERTHGRTQGDEAMGARGAPSGRRSWPVTRSAPSARTAPVRHRPTRRTSSPARTDPTTRRTCAARVTAATRPRRCGRTAGSGTRGVAGEPPDARPALPKNPSIPAARQGIVCHMVRVPLVRRRGTITIWRTDTTPSVLVRGRKAWPARDGMCGCGAHRAHAGGLSVPPGGLLRVTGGYLSSQRRDSGEKSCGRVP
jgi:hypothetical protein